MFRFITIKAATHNNLLNWCQKYLWDLQLVERYKYLHTPRRYSRRSRETFRHARHWSLHTLTDKLWLARSRSTRALVACASFASDTPRPPALRQPDRHPARPHIVEIDSWQSRMRLASRGLPTTGLAYSSADYISRSIPMWLRNIRDNRRAHS
jgi:hypothetical protein